ncbi:MAG: hypothetical protein M9921_14505 [Fimbriimonadaceae bacterium]|nr:hypothetical protein [Chthonomonadaceae bacterium]MCO5298056.1 hypothetical protein [Fimbriimonadaceae bacterium]
MISYEQLILRLDSGWDLERALSTIWKRRGREYTAFGETKSLGAWSRDPRCLVSYETLYRRLRVGWDVERALSVPPIPKGAGGRKWRAVPDGRAHALEAFGEKKTLREWAADPRCQVPYARLRTRVRKDWALEDAISVASAVDSPNFEAFGESKSLCAWERDPRCLVSRQVLRQRMDKGESLESAMTRPPRKVPPRRVWPLAGLGNERG